eukprot:751808-Hanusia_phi.AAC.1
MVRWRRCDGLSIRVEINALQTDDDLLAKGGPAYAIGIDTRVREGKLQGDEELRLVRNAGMRGEEQGQRKDRGE